MISSLFISYFAPYCLSAFPCVASSILIGIPSHSEDFKAQS
uniref:Uncharacterized protein n=1 Tax=Rhizophora mucronata TaxID=61149 RepID=A0A2P2PCB5_RHIMU